MPLFNFVKYRLEVPQFYTSFFPLKNKHKSTVWQLQSPEAFRISLSIPIYLIMVWFFRQMTILLQCEKIF